MKHYHYCEGKCGRGWVCHNDACTEDPVFCEDCRSEEEEKANG